MATLASAKAKYARRTSNPQAAERWKRNSSSARYAEGMGRFLGRGIAGDRVSSYQDGINAAQYRGGDPDRWERGLLDAFSS